MEEIWKDIPDYDGKYQISNMGRILNNHTKRISKGFNHGNGYLYYTFNKDGKKKNAYVHRLVAEAFIPNFENKRTVNHKDFDRTNNTVENLEWSTHKENLKYSSDNMSRARLSKSIVKEHTFGVCYKRLENCYEAYLGRTYLGRRKTFEEAKKLRNKAEMKFLEERGFYENIYN